MTIEIKSRIEPPGFHIKNELQARGWSQVDLAYILDMKPQQLTPILSGKGRISANNAVALSDAFGMPAEFFANLQEQYDLSKAAPPDPGVKKRALWQSVYPIREMINRGWVDDTEPSLLDAQMLRFFESNRIDDVPYMGDDASIVSYAAKKTAYSTTTSAELAWLYRVRQVAKKITAPGYSKDKLIELIPTLKTLLVSPNEIVSIPKLLLNCGVRFVIVETLPKAKIDGVCTWLDNGQPVIAMTTRLDRIDNFWFVLRHEIEHVLCEHGLEVGYCQIDNLDGENAGTGDDLPEDERIANAAASDFCIPRGQIQSLIARKGKFVSEKDMLGFARRLEVHPAIAIGQYQFTTKRWNFLRKYLTSSVSGVRQILLDHISETKQNNSTLCMDGWGYVAPAEL